MKHCMVIYNPHSGKGDFKKHLKEIETYLKDQGFTWNIEETKYPAHAAELYKKAAIENVDLVILSGGDGTMNNLVQSIETISNIPTVAYIPSGTANDFGKTHGLSKDIKKNLTLIKEPTIVKRDIVKSSMGVFNYVAAIGNYVDISYKTNPKLKRLWGFLAYILYGVKAFFINPKIKAKIQANGETFEGKFSLLMITKSKYVGGFSLNKDVILDDGLLTFWALPYSPILNNIYFLIFFIFKWKRIKGFIEIKASEIRIETKSDRVWSLDGEAKKPGNIEVTVLKQKLPMIIHPNAKELFRNV